MRRWRRGDESAFTEIFERHRGLVYGVLSHLMPRDPDLEDVVQAAAEGRFRIHAVKTVDEAMTVLTGVEAGEPDAKGVIPKGTLNHKIATVLAEMTAARHAYSDAEGAAGARQHRRRHGV